jgi:hypothetical protein
VTYRERQRLADIQAAIDAIRSHLQRGDLSDGLVFDAVRIRLLEIGEAVKALPTERLSSQPATCRLELFGPHGTSIGFGHGVRAEGRERQRLLERREQLHPEIRRRVARNYAHDHHAAVRVEPGEERRHCGCAHGRFRNLK